MTVSNRVSPFLTDEDAEEKLMTSADSLFSANSKDNLVRVEFSKNKLAIVTSLKEGTFLITIYNFFKIICSLKNKINIVFIKIFY